MWVDLNRRSPGYEPGGMVLATLPRFRHNTAWHLFKHEYRDGCFFECSASTRPAMKRMAEQSFSNGVYLWDRLFNPTKYVLEVCRNGLDLSEGMSALLDLGDVDTSLNAF